MHPTCATPRDLVSFLQRLVNSILGFSRDWKDLIYVKLVRCQPPIIWIGHKLEKKNENWSNESRYESVDVGRLRRDETGVCKTSTSVVAGWLFDSRWDHVHAQPLLVEQMWQPCLDRINHCMTHYTIGQFFLAHKSADRNAIDQLTYNKRHDRIQFFCTHVQCRPIRISFRFFIHVVGPTAGNSPNFELEIGLRRFRSSLGTGKKEVEATWLRRALLWSLLFLSAFPLYRVHFVPLLKEMKSLSQSVNLSFLSWANREKKRHATTWIWFSLSFYGFLRVSN